jgi:hypothetical protein
MCSEKFVNAVDSVVDPGFIESISGSSGSGISSESDPDPGF